MRHALLPLMALAALTGGCRRTAKGPIGISLIATPPAHVPRAPAPGPLRAVTDQGLVRLDRDGQIVPGLALRWAILDAGRDYIFRIDDASGASAQTLARRLRAALHDAPEPLKAVLGPIDSVGAVTGTVIEVRLSVPQPDLLLLLALPEFGLGTGGPMRIASGDATTMMLRPTGGDEPRPAPVLLHVERAGRAVMRFQTHRSQFVTGGTFANLAVARAAALPRNSLIFDLASGLFGLVPGSADAAADPALRQALTLAIDRDRIVAAIDARGLAKATTIAGSTIEPPLADRLATARALLAGHPAHPRLRVAMPDGPGARLLFALLAQDWGRIGITATAVPADAPADYALIDRVAPPGSLAAFACAASVGCDPRDRLALLAPLYIPIATPVRWSLVDRTLDGFAENALASHPLDQLRRMR